MTERGRQAEYELAVAHLMFRARYPVAAQVLEELADDHSVSPEVFEQVCRAIFDVADRHVQDVPGPPWR